MDIYQELGVRKLINAVGTYTAIGATKMSPQTLRDMEQAAQSFVDIQQLMDAANRKVAELTHNQAACICNSCSTAIYLAMAAAVQIHTGKNVSPMPPQDLARLNVVALWGQHIPYDHAIEQLGLRLNFIGFPNLEAPLDPQVLADAITPDTVCTYFASRTPNGYYGPGCMNLETFIRISHEKHVPVLVDAAAQLPPKHNLWNFTTNMGADMVCFSGGKDLAGPQASGLLLGNHRLLDVAQKLAFPHYGCGRIMKIGREEIVALYSAVRQYLEADEDKRRTWCEEQVRDLQTRLREARHFNVDRIWPNQAGQPLPRAFVKLKNTDLTPEQLRQKLLDGTPAIVCYSENKPGVYVNPMCLQDGDMEAIARRFLELDRELEP